MKKILITGANGQLGSEIRGIAEQFKGFDIIYTDIKELDITDIKALTDFFKDLKPEFVVNCAAYTAVDKAESEKEMAEKINVLAVKNIAQVCKLYSSRLIHISTDYVFDGLNYIPYNEFDVTNPQSVYGLTKLNGEQEILNAKTNSIIIRTSWLYSFFGNNFVKTILRIGKERGELRVVFDQVGTPTYAKDLASSIFHIIQHIIDHPSEIHEGIYNYSNEGVCSWYDFAIEILGFAGIPCKVYPVESKDYPSVTKRPFYSVLNKSKIKSSFNLAIPHWRASLKDCIERLSNV
jgi:dTDP-4-dehydrorhamnose reductase